MNAFPPAFFRRPTLTVARDLVGARLVREPPDGRRLVGRIVETEAYTQDDPAFHGRHLYDETRGLVKEEGRGIELFGPPGEAYVYLCYGVHWLLNVVTEPEGMGGAVLLRAIEPLEGLAVMHERRGVASDRNLTNGPGKLTQAFGLDGVWHGRMLTEPPLYFAAPEEERAYAVVTSPRIGISKGVVRPWRFFIGDNSFVSPARPSSR